MTLVEYFFLFSFFGWGIEVIYQATSKGLIVNRGFLNGPICPIYGTGMVAIKILLDSAPDISSLELFIFGTLFSSLIELTGGFILHKLFHARWWDYSDKPLNFHGYICLEFSLIWGVATLTTVKVICPAADNLYLPDDLMNVIIAFCMLVFLVDLSASIAAAVGLNKKLTEIDRLQSRLRVVSDPLSRQIGTNALETSQKIEATKQQLLQAEAEIEKELEAKKAELEDHLIKTKHFGSGRLLQAFPAIRKRDSHFPERKHK